MQILSVRNATYASVLRFPSIDIEQNRTTFIVGPSGSGKSALLRLLNATLPLSSGEIYYCGKNINQIDTIALRRQVLLAGQQIYLFSGTIEDNFRRYYEYLSLDPLAPKKMEEYLAICRVPFAPFAPCDNMSGGEKQRVYLAICLSLLPSVLMLDEPTSALDDEAARDVIGNMKHFCRENEITLLIVSHDKKLVALYADHIIELKGESHAENS